jgi:RHS repeat-associated protein
MAVNIGILNNPKLYNYHYDQLNRLTGMDVLNGTNTGINLWTNGLTDTADYRERASYDPNGNILTYTRNGYGGTQGMDNLTYHYNSNTNQLNHIGDAVASGNYPNDLDDQSADNYTYDAAGNLIQDKAAGITSDMTWSVYGKLLTIPSKSITYQYDAAGNRIGKTVGSTSTWYVRDAQGNILATYSGENMALQEQDLYGSSRLGTISNPTALSLTSQYLDHLGSGTLFTFTRGKKLFELTNHLGNVLATVSDKKFGTPTTGIPSQISYYTADVKSAQDYYPFGMEMPGRQYNAIYPYSFNGKRDDKDAEYGWQDYGMREYDRRRGQFISVDPITAKYPMLTPYQFASNSPTGGMDADGLEFISSFKKVQKIKFEGEVQLHDTYHGPTLSQQNSSNKSLTQSWRDSKNLFARITYSAANGLYTFPQQLTADARGADYIYNIGGDAYHARGLEDEKQRLSNFADFAATIVPGAPAEAKAFGLFPKLSKKIGWTGKIGEEFLKKFGGVSQKYFATSFGGRYIDQFVNGIAYESKVGYTVLTKDIQMQISKDLEIMATNPEVKRVIWTFFESPVTRKAGASKPLQEALKKAGIETQIIR